MTLLYTRATTFVPDGSSFASLFAAIKSLFPTTDTSASKIKWLARDLSSGNDFALELSPRMSAGSAAPSCRILIAGSTDSKTGTEPKMVTVNKYAAKNLLASIAPTVGNFSGTIQPFALSTTTPYGSGVTYSGYARFAPDVTDPTQTGTGATLGYSQVTALTSADDVAIYVLLSDGKLFGTHLGYAGEAAAPDGNANGLVACLFSSGAFLSGNAPYGIEDDWVRYDPYGGWMDSSESDDNDPPWSCVYYIPEQVAPDTTVVRRALRESFQQNRFGTSQSMTDTCLSSGNRRFSRLEYVDKDTGRRAFGFRLGYGKGFWNGKLVAQTGTSYYTVGKSVSTAISSLMYPVDPSAS